MTNHKEKSQPQLKTCHDQTDTFIYQKELKEGSANDELPPVSENRNLMKHNHWIVYLPIAYASLVV